jgi:TetR/AcrR family transcriptional regulator, transcriptional repressor for nem operon
MASPPLPPPDTRTRILDAAARLFHEQGFHGTGISTILREADVNAGSLYHAFPSKEALLEGVLERYTQLLRPVVMDPVEAATQDPIERVFALLSQYRTWLAPINFTMGCPIGNLALEVGDSHTRARALIRQNFDGWSAVVESWLVAAGDRLPASLDRAQLADFILTVMEGGVMLSRAAGSPAPFDQSVAELRAYFDLLESAGQKPGRKPRTNADERGSKQKAAKLNASGATTGQRSNTPKQSKSSARKRPP